MENVSD